MVWYKYKINNTYARLHLKSLQIPGIDFFRESVLGVMALCGAYECPQLLFQAFSGVRLVLVWVGDGGVSIWSDWLL